MTPSVEQFLADGPRFLRFDGGCVEMRLADASESGEDGTQLLRSLATGNLVAVRITETPTASGFGEGILGM